ncbi:MAG TPA: hypothetical protein VMT20_01070 [Terriglobia bacterium]|nr:hypothetical protein [Terriglobia bacterium]
MRRGIYSSFTGIFLVAAVTAVGAFAQSTSTGSNPGTQTTSAAPSNSTAQSVATPGTPVLGQLTVPAPFDPNKQIVVLPSGSVLHVRLTTTLTSKTNQAGDKFTGEVTQPVVSGDKTIVPEGSLVDGHVTMVKASGRVSGRASMRVVLDHINTPDDVNFNLSGSLQDLANSTCTKGVTDNEGTIGGCGKSKKAALEGAAIVGGIGAATGASIGATQDMICTYYGCPGQNPNIGLDAAYGAGIGAGTALLYSLFKHEKQIVLVSGTDLTFVVDHAVEGPSSPQTASNSGS